MSTNNPISRAAEDCFETYFAEKIWEMIPAFYRAEDGLAEIPDVLRSLVEIIAQQAAIVRRSNDRLWEDQFIELCSNWAVPYLADLMGTRLVSALNTRGRRDDVANTIARRRRSGTLGILEQIISGITDWEGTVTEQFRRLGRTRHGLDPKPGRAAGRFSTTPPGGWANLRSPRISELVDGPFDEYHHTPDFRQPRGKDGLYGISKLAFHLYRLKAYPVQATTPFPYPGHPQNDGFQFTFDPSGRRIPLFMPRNRPNNLDSWRTAREWELPGPIRCRLLGHAEYRINEALIHELETNHALSMNAADELRTLKQARFRTERRLGETLDSMHNDTELLSTAILVPLLNGALIPECGKSALLPNAISVDAGPLEGIIQTSRIISGHVGPTPPNVTGEKRLMIDPEHGCFLFLNDPAPGPVSCSYYYGFSGPIGAGTYDRREVENTEPENEISGGNSIPPASILNPGVTQINDNMTYGPVSNKLQVKNLTIQARNHQRPYLRLFTNWILSTGTNTDSMLTLEGLWIGADKPCVLILNGDYECVTISHCTLDPGGDTDLFGQPIHPVPLLVTGRVEQLNITSSVTGPIRVLGNGVIENLAIRDSIIQSTIPGTKAIGLKQSDVTMERVTVFGETDAHRLHASDTIITGITNVTDTQNGCFRFSLAPSGSRIPRPYPHPPLPFTQVKDWFTSRRFGDPGFGQLSATAPAELQRGAEDGAEIGAFNSLINPIKLDSLRNKIAEYMPFGLLPLFINET